MDNLLLPTFCFMSIQKTKTQVWSLTVTHAPVQLRRVSLATGEPRRQVGGGDYSLVFASLLE